MISCYMARHFRAQDKPDTASVKGEEIQQHSQPTKCCCLEKEGKGLGHIISQHGMTISSDKVDKVINFPHPSYAKQLKSFLGLVNYFHDHFFDMAHKTQPLHHMCSIVKQDNETTYSMD